MYEFTDTIDSTLAGNVLPAEAMSYNGIFLENEIPGYRTLSVSGRELMEAEAQTTNINLVDGSNYIGKRYPSRKITVHFQLICKSNTAFRDAFNKLNTLLAAEQVRIIFNDEPDKFFVGTKLGNETPEPGVNSITSSFEIFCSDCRKFSITETEIIPALNEDGVLEATINNDGGTAVSLDFEITNNSDNGFIGIVSAAGTMQFGSTSEVDGESYKANEQLADLSSFAGITDDTGTNFMYPYNQKGALNYLNVNGQSCLGLGVKGNSVSDNWNGGMRTFTLPTDSSGKLGAKNFTCYTNHWFETGLAGQTGSQTIAFLTSTNQVICGYRVYKNDTAGNTAWIEMIGNGRVLKATQFIPSGLDDQNPFNFNRGHSDIKKEGNKLTFYWFGTYPSFIVPEIADMECVKIQVSFAQYGNRDIAGQYVTRNYLRAITFEKMNVDKWSDTPNRYKSGTICRIDGETGNYYVNGALAPSDEVLGTQYFKAPVGESKVQIVVSDFASPPTVKIKFRKAWL